LQPLPQHNGSWQFERPIEQSQAPAVAYTHGTKAKQWLDPAANRPVPADAHADGPMTSNSVTFPVRVQTCQPVEHAFAGTSQGPRSLPHATPVGGARMSSMPVHVALHPAIRGNRATSLNASRVRSAQPFGGRASGAASAGTAVRSQVRVAGEHTSPAGQGWSAPHGVPGRIDGE
jgi:hypothetical protein